MRTSLSRVRFRALVPFFRFMVVTLAMRPGAFKQLLAPFAGGLGLPPQEPHFTFKLVNSEYDCDVRELQDILKKIDPEVPPQSPPLSLDGSPQGNILRRIRNLGCLTRFKFSATTTARGQDILSSSMKSDPHLVHCISSEKSARGVGDDPARFLSEDSPHTQGADDDDSVLPPLGSSSEALKGGRATTSSNNAFVVEFQGDKEATAVNFLRQAVSCILKVATSKDEVLCLVTSRGGTVDGYGFAASQLSRLRQAGIPLTVCVDKCAVSGGYMMASVANKIVVSDFAYLGSIGVIATVINVNKAIKKLGMEAVTIKAGTHKSTIDAFNEITKEGAQAHQAMINQVHTAFKAHIARYRPGIPDLESVADGTVWLGQDAVEKGLADVVMTSDGYIESLVASGVRVVMVKKLEKPVGFLRSLQRGGLGSNRPPQVLDAFSKRSMALGPLLECFFS
eukprot:CAMPEP_0185759092 /NCGR_PEP_ID=MMETSP1174-20130828/17799_1 /TAXON_ID=35687 /ORGANISM="Dictyocha speculum, Strain CCMP1381" /LENGTH=450 /DNA_ID=CAMNT_0028439259 /DNA_START=107 /DNA_END=1459 /DNA_ORIENTATION=+